MLANEKNLIPLNKRAKSVQREIQSKGGKAKAENEKKKRLLKDCMLELLDMPVSDVRKWNKLSKMGIDPEKIDNRTLLVVSAFLEAVNNGNITAFKEIRDLIGENNKNTDDDLDALDSVLEKIKGNI